MPGHDGRSQRARLSTRTPISTTRHGRRACPGHPKTDAALYRAVYPEEFKAIARPLGVTGTVVVEASPWLEDNQWLLDLAARDPFLLGIVGNVIPGRAEFAQELERFTANPLFLGVRAHGTDRSMDFGNEAVRRDLGLLATTTVRSTC